MTDEPSFIELAATLFGLGVFAIVIGVTVGPLARLIRQVTHHNDDDHGGRGRRIPAK